MIPDSLQLKASELHFEFEKRATRKALWISTTQTQIERILKAIEQSPIPLKWYVQKAETFVNIRLQSMPSVTEGSFEGGILTYMLNPHGRITVAIVSMYIPGVIEQGDTFVINNQSYEPEEINRDLIFSHVEIFLERMMTWESNKKLPIGFRQFPPSEDKPLAHFI